MWLAPQQQQQRAPASSALDRATSAVVMGTLPMTVQTSSSDKMPTCTRTAAAACRPSSEEGHLNCVTTEEASTDEQVIVGKLNINSISKRVLFDSRASHSFMNEGFVHRNNLPTRQVDHAFQIVAAGITHEATWIVSQS